MRSTAWPGCLRVVGALGALVATSASLSACGLVVGIQDIDVTTGAGGGGGDAGDGGSGGGSGGDVDAGPDVPPPRGLGCDDAIPLVFAGFGALEFDAETPESGTIEGGPFTGCTTSSGPEHVYVFDAPGPGFLTASLPAAATSFDSVLYARRTSCSNPDGIVLCHDQVPGTLGGELISFPVTAGERIYLFVDGVAPEDRGAYHLTVSFSPGASCAGPVPIVLGTGVGSFATLLGANEPGMDNHAMCGKCTTSECAGLGRQTIYSIKAPLAKEVEVRLQATFDAVLYARTTCENKLTQLAQDGCVDAPDKGNEVLFVPGGVTPTILVVDTNADSPAGPFSIRLNLK
ncbi:hypothetical protein [Polyangium spumosum]|uniref:Uncharacterized protein n=1 Tax=Polyangium spumosum TaxID=889282 RepID=A0A6N7PJB8_9BACT|nr:hypothetical protein [Polyangium spumosum]MRG92212.1 hypothetical protein [Polyangium spumosum]